MADVETHVQVKGHESHQVNTSVADVQNQPPPENSPPSPASLGVSQEQFDKYFNAEKGYDWQSHARELEWKAKQNGTDKPADAPADGPKPQADPVVPKTEDEGRQVVSDAGLDWDALNQKIGQQGDLDKEDYDALAKANVPEEVIKDYVKSVNAQAQMTVEKIQAAFGGEEGFLEMRDWAQGHYSEAELDKLTVEISEPATMDATIAKVKADRAAATAPGTTKDGLLNTPNSLSRPGGEAQGFSTEAEMLAAMRDPRYRRDPVYRQGVEARVAKSNWGGNPRSHSL